MSDDWITLNVGGTLLSTTRTTLISCADSVLAKMFDPDSSLQASRMVDGAYIIDSDPDFFKVILNWLRYRRIISTNAKLSLDGLLVVAEYFDLSPLVEQLSEEINKKEEDDQMIRTIVDKLDGINKYLKINVSNGENIASTLMKMKRDTSESLEDIYSDLRSLNRKVKS
jgi:hypothetical protein